MSQANTSEMKRNSAKLELSTAKLSIAFDVKSCSENLEEVEKMMKQGEITPAQYQEYAKDMEEYQAKMIEYQESLSTSRLLQIAYLKNCMLKIGPTYRNLQAYITYLNELATGGHQLLFSDVDHAKQKNDKLKRFTETLRLGIKEAWPHWSTEEERDPVCYEAEKLYYEVGQYSTVASNKILVWRDTLPGQALLEAMTASCKKVSLFPVDSEAEKMEELGGGKAVAPEGEKEDVEKGRKKGKKGKR